MRGEGAQSKGVQKEKNALEEEEEKDVDLCRSCWCARAPVGGCRGGRSPPGGPPGTSGGQGISTCNNGKKEEKI